MLGKLSINCKSLLEMGSNANIASFQLVSFVSTPSHYSLHFRPLNRVFAYSCCFAFLLHLMFLFSQLWLVGEAHEKLSKCRTCNFNSSSAALRKTISFRVAAVRVSFIFAVSSLPPHPPQHFSVSTLACCNPWMLVLLRCCCSSVCGEQKCLILSCQRRTSTECCDIS